MRGGDKLKKFQIEQALNPDIEENYSDIVLETGNSTSRSRRSFPSSSKETTPSPAHSAMTFWTAVAARM
jgi:hypothetical protein